MENIYRNIMLAVLFSAQVAVVSAQSPVPQVKDLVGTWGMDAQEIIRNLGKAEKAVFGSLPGIQRERFVNSFGSKVFGFGESGDFSASWEDHGKSLSGRGTWALEGDGRLRIVFPDGVFEFRISFPFANRMVLERLNSKGGMVKTLFFTKSLEQ